MFGRRPAMRIAILSFAAAIAPAVALRGRSRVRCDCDRRASGAVGRLYEVRELRHDPGTVGTGQRRAADGSPADRRWARLRFRRGRRRKPGRLARRPGPPADAGQHRGGLRAAGGQGRAGKASLHLDVRSRRQIPIPDSQSDAFDPANPEPDGLDEVFLPADVGRWQEGNLNGAIMDDQIGKWLAQMRDKGADVWIVFDCCHSGSMSRRGAG